MILLLDGIVERGSPIQANRTLAVVRKMFNFAISRDIIDATPVAMVRAPAKENQRDRILSAKEIKTFWKGLADAPMTQALTLQDASVLLLFHCSSESAPALHAWKALCNTLLPS